jgi:hypothetical protein
MSEAAVVVDADGGYHSAEVWGMVPQVVAPAST